MISSGLGTKGVFELYSMAKANVDLAGPTYFAPLITGVAGLTHSSMLQNPTVYNILLILTDGDIHDMDQTKMELIKASKLPLSVIIVGVGNENFEKMHDLDCDGGFLSCNGMKADRDIVQFVKFNDAKSPEDLASKVLRELPEQVIQFYKSVGRTPKDVIRPFQ